MKDKWLAKLLDMNKELLLIFSIIAFAGVINFFVAGQRLVLTFYNLPTLFAAFYFGRSRAVQTAIASALIVCWLNLANTDALAGAMHLRAAPLMGWMDLTVWAGFLIVTAYAMGTLYEVKEQSMRDLRETYYGVLQILSQFISKDKYTQNHSYRVSVYATQIGHCLGLREDRVEDLRAAALLHDIGKLDISREILYKAARLKDDETTTPAGNVEKGVSMLKPLGGSLRRVLPIVLSHRDKFDGSGHSVSRITDIPLEARIISVADVYDSLTTDRPYRKGMSPFEARDVVSKGSGTDFDPSVVEAFEAAFRAGQLEVPEVAV